MPDLIEVKGYYFGKVATARPLTYADVLIQFAEYTNYTADLGSVGVSGKIIHDLDAIKVNWADTNSFRIALPTAKVHKGPNYERRKQAAVWDVLGMMHFPEPVPLGYIPNTHARERILEQTQAIVTRRVAQFNERAIEAIKRSVKEANDIVNNEATKDYHARIDALDEEIKALKQKRVALNDELFVHTKKVVIDEVVRLGLTDLVSVEEMQKIARAENFLFGLA